MVYALAVLTVLVLMVTAYGLFRHRSRARRLRNRKSAPAAVPLAPRAQVLKLKENGKYWGYRIQSHCRAASRFSGKEYEIDQSPPLPVENCGENPCTCGLIGLRDRRLRVERRSGDDRRRTLRMESVDRRSGHPRRKADEQRWNAYRHL